MKSIKPSGEDFLYIDIESIDNKKQIIMKVKKYKKQQTPQVGQVDIQRKEMLSFQWYVHIYVI